MNAADQQTLNKKIGSVEEIDGFDEVCSAAQRVAVQVSDTTMLHNEPAVGLQQPVFIAGMYTLVKFNADLQPRIVRPTVVHLSTHTSS